MKIFRSLIILSLFFLPTKNSLFSQNSILESYSKDWFIDLAPKDRSVTNALLKAIREIEGNDSLQVIELKVIPSANKVRPNFNLYFIPFPTPQTPQPVTSAYQLSYNNLADQYLILPQPQPPLFQNLDVDVILTSNPVFPPPQQLLSTSKYDLNGDGIFDRIDGCVLAYAKPSTTAPKWDYTKFPPLEALFKIYLGTEIGLIDDESISQSVFDYRIGYIAGYSSSFTKNFSNTQVPKSNLSSTNLVASYKLPLANPNFIPLNNNPVSEDLKYDPKSICSKYEDLSKRPFLNYLRNKILLSGLNKGVSDAIEDAKILTSKLNSILDNNYLKSTKQNSELKDSSKAIAYTNLQLDFIKSLMNIPLFRITLKNRNTGETKNLIEEFINVQDDVNAVNKNGTLYSDFIAKIKRPITNDPSSPFFKPIDQAGNWYLLSPGLLSGQISAYVNILALVNDKNTTDQLKALDFDAQFWLNMTSSFQNQLMIYSDEDISVLGTSIVGVNSLLYREGFRNSSLYIIKANSEISFDNGKENAVKEIVDFLASKFPEFKPVGNITTTEQANAAIGNFVSGLYSTINQLDGTIKNLNTLLLNANARVVQLEGVLNNLNKAANGISRSTNVIGNTLEVAYWGSSIGGLHAAGQWISDLFHL